MKPEARKVGKIDPSELRLLTIDRETRTGEIFSALKLDGLTVIESSLHQCSFVDVRARSACFGAGTKQSTFEDCVFSRCQLTFAPVGNVRLVRCRFEACRLELMIGAQIELIECKFDGTTIRGAVFHGQVDDPAQLRPRRRVNEFHSNDFSGAELEDVDFRGGIDLTQQTLPAGENYLFISDTCKASRIVRELQPSIVDVHERERSQSLATLLDFYCSTGQQTQLLRVRSLGGFEQQLRSHLLP